MSESLSLSEIDSLNLIISSPIHSPENDVTLVFTAKIPSCIQATFCLSISLMSGT